jgi:hypothetical protein
VTTEVSVDHGAGGDGYTDIERELAAAFARNARVAAEGVEVRGAILAKILCAPADPDAGWPRPGLRLTGARVTGRLDLSFVEVAHPLMLDDCEFDEAPMLYWSRLRYTSFAGSRLPGLVLPNAEIAGHLRLTGCRVDGALNLRGTKVQGGLLLDGATLTWPGAVVLDLERAEVGGDLVAGRGFRAVGGLRLFQATIGGGVHIDGSTVDASRVDAPGQDDAGGDDPGVDPADVVAIDLDNASVRGGLFARGAEVTGELTMRHATVGVVALGGSTLRRPGGVAVRMDRAQVNGGVFLAGTVGCRVTGEVRMVSAQVGRTVRMSGATIDNPGGTALRVDGIAVDGSFDCQDGFSARGLVSLVDARVAGPVWFMGARLDNPGGVALRATGIQAGAVFNCCEGFVATGRVSINGARIASRLCFDAATLTDPDVSLRCSRTEAAELSLRYADIPSGTVDLRHTRIGILRDDPRVWPDRLSLDGLTYATLEPQVPVARRIAWLAREPDGLPPQPYEQLAATYRRTGDDAEARAVLFARQQRRRRAGTARPAKVWSWLQEITVGYGYRPRRAVLWLAALLLIGAVAFGLAPPDRVATAGPVTFNSLAYALDLLLPVVSFGQEQAFEPRGGTQWLAYLLIASGWLLATTAAAGLTRTISRS